MKFKKFLLSAVWMGMVAAASAQAIPSGAGDLGPTVSKNSPIALSFNYTAMIGNAPPGTCGCFLLNGGSSEELFYVWKNIGAVVQVAGNRAQNIPQSQQGLSMVTYMAGPRYSFRTTRRLTTYGQFLVGGVHGFDTYFPVNGTQPTGAANSLAFAPGGGFEIGIRDWLSIRPVEAEFLVTQLPNNLSEHQHNLRISSGVVIRFSSLRLNR